MCNSRVMLCRVKVKSEQMSLEYFAEDSKWFCCPDIGEECVLPHALGRVFWPVFGCRWVQFRWRHWRPLSWIGCGPQQEASGGHGGRGSHGRIWLDWTVHNWGLLGVVLVVEFYSSRKEGTAIPFLHTLGVYQFITEVAAQCCDGVLQGVGLLH